MYARPKVTLASAKEIGKKPYPLMNLPSYTYRKDRFPYKMDDQVL